MTTISTPRQIMPSQPTVDAGLGMHLIADLPGFADIRPYIERMDAVRWYSNFGQLVLDLERKLTQLLSTADRTPANGAIALTTMSTCW